MSDLARRVDNMGVRLQGIWFNQFGSRLNLTVDETGRLAGTFDSSVGGVDRAHPVTGFFAADTESPDGAVGFAVSWGTAHSLTVWSGHYREKDDAIFTVWLLSEASSAHGDWRSTSVGHDEFRRVPSDQGGTLWPTTRAHSHS